MKKGPEYEVKCRAGGAVRESAPRSQSGTLWKHDNVMEDPNVLSQVVYQLRLRSEETNVVSKEKEDGGENGRSEVVNVGADVLEQVRIGSERENAEGRGVVSYRSSLRKDPTGSTTFYLGRRQNSKTYMLFSIIVDKARAKGHTYKGCCLRRD